LLEQGILNLSDSAGFGPAGMIIFDGATLRLDGSGALANNFEILGSGVGGTHGAIEVTANNSWSLSGSILLDGSTTFNVGQSSGLGLYGSVSGTGPLNKTGLGTLAFGGAGNNTYSGSTVVSAGTLALAK